MDTILIIFTATSSGALAAAFAWAILTHRVEDGVLIKLGLICICLGLAGTAYHLIDGLSCADLLGLNRARALTQAGMIICIFGYWLYLRAGRTLSELVDVSWLRV